MVEDIVINKIFAQVSSRFPERVCLQIKKDSVWQRWTYKEIEDLSLRIGAFFVKEGFKKGRKERRIYLSGHLELDLGIDSFA